MEIQIRKAAETDLIVLYGFEQGVIQAERPFDATLKNNPIHYYDLEEMIAAPHIHLVVAEFNGQIISCGYARIEQAEHFLNHQQHAYLGFMYTVPEFRGQGVNKKVMDELKGWAKSKNIRELRLRLYFDNIPARKAYEKVGFTKHMIMMRTEI